jgi:hypothetical protein
MQKCPIFMTPPKEVNDPLHAPETADFTPETRGEFEGLLNYKAKTFKLMKQLA